MCSCARACACASACACKCACACVRVCVCTRVCVIGRVRRAVHPGGPLFSIRRSSQTEAVRQAECDERFILAAKASRDDRLGSHGCSACILIIHHGTLFTVGVTQARTCTRAGAHAPTHTHARTHTPTRARAHAHTHTRTHANTDTNARVRTHAHVRTCARGRTHAH